MWSDLGVRLRVARQRRTRQVNDTPLSQLLGLADSAASGEFVCESDGAEAHVFLQSGRIAWASDSRHPRAFTQHLKEHAGLDAGSREEAVAEARRSHVPIGETLVAWKLATKEQVRAALRCQIDLALAVIEQPSAAAKAVFLDRKSTR